LRVFILATIVLVAACSGSSESTIDETEPVGEPPAPGDDPFYFKTMPAEAVPAEPAGSIGGEERRGNVDPTISFRCFSCVKICPETDPNCRRSDDVICGWGVHPEEGTASRLATAECDGALDVARDMPRFSTISGDCPRATCQMPE